MKNFIINYFNTHKHKMKNPKNIIGLSIIVLLMVVVGLGLISGVSQGANAIGSEDIQQQIDNLETLNAINSEAYMQRAEQARKERTHCAIADHLEVELTTMQQANSARRKQIKIMQALLPKVSAL